MRFFTAQTKVAEEAFVYVSIADHSYAASHYVYYTIFYGHFYGHFIFINGFSPLRIDTASLTGMTTVLGVLTSLLIGISAWFSTSSDGLTFMTTVSPLV